MKMHVLRKIAGNIVLVAFYLVLGIFVIATVTFLVVYFFIYVIVISMTFYSSFSDSYEPVSVSKTELTESEYPFAGIQEPYEYLSAHAMGTHDALVKANMKDNYTVEQFIAECRELKKKSYPDYRFRMVENPASNQEGRIAGLPEDWHDSPFQDKQEWWNPPEHVSNGVAILLDFQWPKEKSSVNRAQGLYLLFSSADKKLWIWQWNHDHVRLEGFNPAETDANQ